MLQEDIRTESTVEVIKQFSDAFNQHDVQVEVAPTTMIYYDQKV